MHIIWSDPFTLFRKFFFRLDFVFLIILDIQPRGCRGVYYCDVINAFSAVCAPSRASTKPAVLAGAGCDRVPVPDAGALARMAAHPHTRAAHVCKLHAPVQVVQGQDHPWPMLLDREPVVSGRAGQQQAGKERFTYSLMMKHLEWNIQPNVVWICETGSWSVQ